MNPAMHARGRRLLTIPLAGAALALCLTPELRAGAQESEPPEAAPSPPPPLLLLSDAPGGARIDSIDSAIVGADLLRRGDVVIATDRRRIRTATDLDAYLSSLDPGTAVLLELIRGGRGKYVGVQLPAAEIPAASGVVVPSGPVPGVALPGVPTRPVREAPVAGAAGLEGSPVAPPPTPAPRPATSAPAGAQRGVVLVPPKSR